MIKLDTTYDDYVITDDPDYPGGKALDADSPDAQNGTPYKADWMNDINGFFQALVVDAYGEFRVSGQPERVGASDLLNALKVIIGRMIGGNQTPAELYAADRGNGAIGDITPVVPAIAQRVRNLYPNGIAYNDIMSIGRYYCPKLDRTINLGEENPVPYPITAVDFYAGPAREEFGRLITDYYSVIHDLYLGTVNPLLKQAYEDKYR
jgi:hypothetical protein